VFRCFGVSVFRCFGEKDRNLQTADLGKGQWFAAEFMGKPFERENSYTVRLANDSFGKSSGGVFLRETPSRSGVFEDENAAIVERDLGSFPCLQRRKT